MANRFTIGRQPCQDYVPKLDGNGYAEWDNVHQCIYCGDDTTVSFCLTCCRDHHENGYETCKYAQGKTDG